MSKNVSNSFKSVIKKAGPFYAYAKITLSNGTEFILDSVDDFMDSENSYSEQPDSGFPLGLALSKSIKISIDSKVAIEEVLQDTLSEDIKDSSNDNIKTYIEKTLKDLFMARIVLYTEADLDNGTKERIQEGIFTVIDAVYPGDVIEITAYDDMYKADQIFTSHSSFPTSAQTLLNEVCGSCDITLGSATFRNNNFQIQQAPEGKTGRQVIGYIAQIAAGNAVISPQGRLIIKSYDVNFPEGENPSASEIESESGIHIISQYIDDPTIGVDDVTITGVSTNIENEDSGEDESYLSGSDDYSIKIDNPLIVGHEKNAVDMIAQSIIGIKMRPFSGNFMPDPTIEFMDMAYLIDKKDNFYQTIVTAHNFTYLGSSALECGAESPARFGEYYSDASEVYQKAKDQIRKNKTQWEQAIENLTNQVANASGFYVTEEEQSDGSVIAYMHNKPTLEESNYVWKMTSESISVSTDGGEHWNGGITVNGEVIATIMSTIGINFDWGVGGTLSIQDSDGNQTMYLDAETGVVRINAASLKITGKTIEEIIDEHPVSVNLTQEEIFNILTNNGKSEGIFMEDGQLYINASYIGSGAISIQTPQGERTFYANTETGEVNINATSLKISGKTIEQYIDNKIDSYIPLTVQLTNEFAGVPTDANGESGDYSECYTEVKVYMGNTNITENEDVAYTVNPSSGVIGNWNEANHRYTVTGMTTDSGSVSFSVTYSGFSMTKQFDISKTKQGTPGADGRTYFLIINPIVISQDSEGNYTPDSISVGSYYRDGQSANRYPYTGTIVIEESTNGSSFTQTAQHNASQLGYGIRGSDVKSIRITVYAYNDLSTPLDVQTVTVVKEQDMQELSQEDIFNILTNNGQTQGIFLRNGKIYINASYIQSGTLSANLIKGGTLKLGGSNNTYGTLQILNSRGNVIGTWNKDGIEAENATITGVINGTSGHIGNWTFTENGITSNVKFNELTGGDSGLIEQSTKVKYQVQLLKYGVTEVNRKYIAMIIRTRAGSSTSSFLQRFSVAYDGTVTVGVPSGENIQITTDGQIQFKNGTTTRAYIDMRNSSTLRIHATNIQLDGNVIEPL